MKAIHPSPQGDAHTVPIPVSNLPEAHVAFDAILQQKAERSEQWLELAMEASGTGTWERNLQTDELIWSSELSRIFNFPLDQQVTYKQFLAHVHPGDRDRLLKVHEKAKRHGKVYKVEYRIVWDDGSVHWVLSRGKAYLENGKAVRMMGALVNIDDSKKQHELEDMNAVLQEQRSELMTLNQAKDEFISIASHQLRTPASSVKQYIGMLLEGYVGDLSELQAKMLRAAYESNERQLVIVDDLLKVAQVDAGKIRLVKESRDLRDLLDSVIEEQRAKFKGRNQTLKYRRSRNPLIVEIDVRLLRMVIENLLDNASKYSYPDQAVSVTVRRLHGRLTISIKDSGVGINKKDQKKLFQKFARITNALSAEVDGTGLGLYWARQIVDLHEGSIEVISSLKKGSTFVISLPMD